MTCDPSLDVGCKIGQVYMGFVLWSLSSSDCDCLGCLQGISSLEIGNSVGVNKIFEKDDVALVEQVIRMSPTSKRKSLAAKHGAVSPTMHLLQSSGLRLTG